MGAEETREVATQETADCAYPWMVQPQVAHNTKTFFSSWLCFLVFRYVSLWVLCTQQFNLHNFLYPDKVLNWEHCHNFFCYSDLFRYKLPSTMRCVASFIWHFQHIVCFFIMQTKESYSLSFSSCFIL